ncbi:MAG: hypothetical protein ACM3NI_08570 [Bacteroidota bacterium]
MKHAAGITLTCDLGQPCANGFDRAFSVTLNLPGGTLIDFNTALFTKTGAAAYMTDMGRSTADFGDTAGFQLIFPERVR